MKALMESPDGPTAPQRIGAPLFSDTWRNAKVGRVAYLVGQGWTAQAIADALADGTTACQITAMVSHWGLSLRACRRNYSLIPVAMSAKHRGKLAAEAVARGMEMPDLVATLLATVAKDGLFAAVLD